MDDQVELDWDTFGASAGSPAFDATVRFATALVQDGMSRVRVVVPREPWVLTRARHAARLAGVSVLAENVGSTTITMQFSSQPPRAPGVPTAGQPKRERRARADRRGRWSRVLDWFVSATR